MATRLAILADIHANVWALDAVLARMQGPWDRRFVNLGDTLYGPLKPHATYERLMHENVLITIQGNQDRLIYEASERDLAAIPDTGIRHSRPGRGTDPLAEQLPRDGGGRGNDVFLCHGTPGSDMIYLLEDVMEGLPEVRSEGAIRELFRACEVRWCCAGIRISRAWSSWRMGNW